MKLMCELVWGGGGVGRRWCGEEVVWGGGMGGGGMGGSGMGRRWYAGEQILFNRAAETLASERAAFEAEKKAHLELFEQQQKVHEGERGR